jgi:hypothetical protein
LKKISPEKIISDNFVLPAGYDIVEVTHDLINNLGSLSGQQRDYSYMILSTWILYPEDVRSYTQQQLVELQEIVINHIQNGLGNSIHDDTIFLRAYSILVLNDLLQVHQKYPYLSREEVIGRLDLALSYLDKEQDLRGFVNEEKGWAHGIAHIADTFMILSADTWLEEAHLNSMLSSISKRIKQPTVSLFIHSEEERLARAVVNIFSRQLLSRQSIDAFLRRLTVPDKIKTTGKFVWEDFDKNPWRYVLTSAREDLVSYRNLQNFIRSIYFQWKACDTEMDKKQYVQERLDLALDAINLGFYNKESGFFIT